MYDFIVIGAGMAGASAASELARSSRVCLIEAEDQPGVHATGRSAALFAPTYGGRQVRAITRASRAFFDRPPEGFSDQALLRPRGCLYIARADQRAQLDRMAGDIQASGGSVTIETGVSALARIPRLRPEYLAAAIFDAEAMDIDVDALHQGFLRHLRSTGATLLTSARATRARRQNGVWRLQLEGEVVEAPVIVNAAGAWADQVAGACGAREVGLQPLRRTAILVDPPVGVDIRDWPAVIDTDEMFYFKPEAGKLLISPADESPDTPGDAQPQELDIAVGVDRVQAALDIEVRRVSHSWAGLRTFAPDRIPVIGFDPRVRGLFWCAGQGGYGIQTAPGMARVVAALASLEALPQDLLAEGLDAEELSPHRFVEAVTAKRLGDG
jgi:D-arginine dehydrogenase